jgi:predicted nucleic acid-binding protein
LEDCEEEGVGRPRGTAGGTVFCDTNVLVRILTGDPPAQARSAARALEMAGEGRFALMVPDIVVAEVVYVLISSGFETHRAAELIDRLLDLPGIEVVDEVMLRDAVMLWSQGRLDFADAYLAALTRRISDSSVLSFDRDFDRVESVTRLDPDVVGR